MMRPIFFRRLASVVLCAAVLALTIAPAAAQDARESMVQAAARAWLQIADRLDGAQTWQTAGARFKTAMTQAQWTAALRSARGPLGSVRQRASVATKFSTQVPGLPDGEYALAQFRTAFEKKTEGHESVTLEREADGAWRVIGYFIR